MTMTIQDKLNELDTLAKSCKRLLIMPHDNPDPDAMSSAAALHYLMSKRHNIQCTIAYGGIIGRAENRTMMKLLNIPTRPLQEIKFIKFTHFALLDTQPMTGNNSLPSSIKPSIVIDHHPLRKQTCSDFLDIRVDYGATATILTEYMKASGLEIPCNLATALFYGISSETQDLGREARPVDTQAYHALFPLINKRALSQIAFPILPHDYFVTLQRCLQNTYTYRHIIISKLGNITNPDHVSLIADLLLRHERMGWSFVIGRYTNKLLLSARTSNPRANAGSILTNVVKPFGTAGGHKMIAGGKIDCNGKQPEEIMALENEIVERFLKRTMRQQIPAGKPLLETLIETLV
ncbi:MAG: DHH family phosphoesterase [Chlamydiota bacterium]|nr:DHH family phosphoesterase [Chlamydiota bacterium]